MEPSPRFSRCARPPPPTAWAPPSTRPHNCSPAIGGREDPGIAVAFQRLQTTTSDLVHRAWPRLTLATAAYVGLQATLLAGCLGAAGAHLPIAVTLAAFAVNRALTTAIVTPGGVGITETGTLALLLSLGAPASPATAGVLLFGTFTYALEIPLGGLMWTAVLTSRYHPPRRPTATDRS